jgi:hypothetical protein
MLTASTSAALDSQIQLVRAAAEATHTLLPLQQTRTSTSSNSNSSSSSSSSTAATRPTVAQGLNYSVSLTAHTGPSRSFTAAVLPLQLRTAITVPAALAALMKGCWCMVTTVTTAGPHCSNVSAAVSELCVWFGSCVALWLLM